MKRPVNLPDVFLYGFPYFFCVNICFFVRNIVSLKEFKAKIMLIKELIKRRKELKISQEELAEKIGVRRSTISDFENEKSSLGFRKTELLFKALGLGLCKDSEIYKIEMWDMAMCVACQLRDKTEEEIKKMNCGEMYELTREKFLLDMKVKENTKKESFYNLFRTMVCFWHTQEPQKEV